MIAIALALITKEVYSSLFIGILMGGLLYSNFSFEGTVLHAFQDGIVASLSDSRRRSPWWSGQRSAAASAQSSPDGFFSFS